MKDIDENNDGELEFEELKPTIMQFVKAMVDIHDYDQNLENTHVLKELYSD